MHIRNNVQARAVRNSLEPCSHTFKVMVIGSMEKRSQFLEMLDAATGQTDNSTSNYGPTLGMDFKVVFYQQCRFTFWIMSHHARFMKLHETSLTGAQAVIQVDASTEQKQLIKTHFNADKGIVIDYQTATDDPLNCLNQILQTYLSRTANTSRRLSEDNINHKKNTL